MDKSSIQYEVNRNSTNSKRRIFLSQLEIMSLQLELLNGNIITQGRNVKFVEEEYLDTKTVIKNVNSRIKDFHNSKISELKFIESAYANINLYTAVSLLKSFQSKGLFKVNGEKLKLSDIKNKLDIIDKHDRLFKTLLGVLEKFKFIELSDNTVITLDIDNIKTVSINPDFKPFFDLLDTTISGLHSILTGMNLATDIMFPKGSSALVEAIYVGNKISDYFNKMIAVYVGMYVEELFKISKQDRIINILEIGAGTGSTSRFVMERLKEHKDRVKYCYTDISAGFVRNGKKNYASKYPFTSFKVLDIEKNVCAQDFELHQYDIIFASNVIHATSSISQTLGQVKRLLRQNGIFIVNELTMLQDFLTLTFGLLDGWWLYKDEEIRINKSPLLSLNAWKNAYMNNGFGCVEVFPLIPNVNSDCYQSIICGISLDSERV